MSLPPQILQSLLARAGSPAQGDGYQTPEPPTPDAKLRTDPALVGSSKLKAPLRANTGSGTAMSGFVTSDELPVEDRTCEKCVHFNGGNCDEPHVEADTAIPDYEQRKNPDGTIKVQPDECCNFVKSDTSSKENNRARLFGKEAQVPIRGKQPNPVQDNELSRTGARE